jgi:hypothetical protein
LDFPYVAADLIAELRVEMGLGVTAGGSPHWFGDLATTVAELRELSEEAGFSTLAGLCTVLERAFRAAEGGHPVDEAAAENFNAGVEALDVVLQLSPTAPLSAEITTLAESIEGWAKGEAP